jgi:hypothetical protein
VRFGCRCVFRAPLQHRCGLQPLHAAFRKSGLPSPTASLLSPLRLPTSTRHRRRFESFGHHHCPPPHKKPGPCAHQQAGALVIGGVLRQSTDRALYTRIWPLLLICLVLQPMSWSCTTSSPHWSWQRQRSRRPTRAETPHLICRTACLRHAGRQTVPAPRRDHWLRDTSLTALACFASPDKRTPTGEPLLH